jgi:hypothetical protein
LFTTALQSSAGDWPAGTILAVRHVVRRRFFVFFAAAAAVLAAAWAMAPVTTQRIESPGVAHATPSVPAGARAGERPAPARVTIQQQLVHADVTAETVRTARPPSSVKRATPPPRKDGFFARARRVIFGGGRHKPSPFPAAQ